MSNGKGSNPRKFTKKGHKKVLDNWDEPYPERKPGKPGKTTYVYRDGKLVDKEKLNVIEFPAIPTDYYDHIEQLQLMALGQREKVMKEVAVPKKLLGVK